jgi:hypothetical protein
MAPVLNVPALPYKVLSLRAAQRHGNLDRNVRLACGRAI